MQSLFERDGTFRVREIEAADHTMTVLCFIDGLVNGHVLNENIIRPIQHAQLAGGSAEQIIRQTLATATCRPEQRFSELAFMVSLGNGILFVEGIPDAVVIDIKSWPVRGIAEPDNERVLQGPREGFNEALLTNVALVRRRLTGSDFKAEYLRFGEVAENGLCLCYLESCVDKKVLQEVRRRLEGLELSAVLDTNYIAEQIRDSRDSSFRTIGATERPDIVAAKLLEGRVAILCEGCPTALTAPYLFLELFQCNEDYYVSYHYASFQRCLRIFGFFLSILLPSFFIALVCYQPDLLPSALTFTVAEARQNVPFSTVGEAVLLLLIFDLLRESGARSPSNVGQALSVVSSIVLGQAASEAGYVGAPILIITAFAGVTGVMSPRLFGVSLLYRYSILLLTSVCGYLGFCIGFFALLLRLSSIESFGVPYTQYAYLSSQRQTGDTFLRASWSRLRALPVFPVRERGKGH
ncbi:MAG: spore germination protein [Clostridia bacterium]|nr:spore germination protein [Clostridia bacterium]